MTSHEVEVAELRAMLEEKDAVIRSLHARNDDLKASCRFLAKMLVILAGFCFVSAIIDIMRIWI